MASACLEPHSYATSLFVRPAASLLLRSLIFLIHYWFGSGGRLWRRLILSHVLAGRYFLLHYIKETLTDSAYQSQSPALIDWLLVEEIP